MLIEQYLESVKLRFKWRRLICAAVRDARAEMCAKKGHAEGCAKNKNTDPTGTAAVKNMSWIKCVRITPRKGDKPVYIQEPERWLAVIDAVYAEYKIKSPFVEQAMRMLFDERKNADVIAGLMGVSRQAFYLKQQRFLIDAAFLAMEQGLLKK